MEYRNNDTRTVIEYAPQSSIKVLHPPNKFLATTLEDSSDNVYRRGLAAHKEVGESVTIAGLNS